MPQKSVDSLKKFIEMFPDGGKATVTFSAEEGRQYIKFGVNLYSNLYLTYTEVKGGFSHGDLKRLATELVEKFDSSGLRRDIFDDVTPLKKTYTLSLSNGIIGWYLVDANEKSACMDWSTDHPLNFTGPDEKQKFREELKLKVIECHSNFERFTGLKPDLWLSEGSIPLL